MNGYTTIMSRACIATAFLVASVGVLFAQADAPALVDQAERAVAARDFARAADLYQQLEARESVIASYAYNLGVVWLELDEIENALAAFDRARQAGLQSAALDYNRGIALYRLERYGDALIAFDAALATAPEDGDAAVNRALTLLELEGADVAEAELLALTEARPDMAVAWVHAGNIAFDRADYTTAAQRFERALTVDPTDRVALLNRGNALLLAGRPEAALQQYEALQRIDPKFPDLAANLDVARQAVAQLERQPPTD